MNSHSLIINGGLGNQMFQYAFLLQLREQGYHVEMDTSLYQYINDHNGYELNTVFKINEKTKCQKGLHLAWLRLLLKYKWHLLVTSDINCLKAPSNIILRKYVIGYWQNERFFESVKGQLRKKFVFCGIDEGNLQVAQEMSGCNSVSVHIRRGDYVTLGLLVQEDQYYDNAIRCIMDRVDDPVFYIFSDDMEEARTIISKYCDRYKIIDWNKGKDSYKDMYLMSKCRHHIIANSSFSWWGAWLNPQKGEIVVAPKDWTSDPAGVCPQLAYWIKY